MLDIFNSDAFSAMELTSFVDRHPFLPTGIGSLGIFDPLPIRTTALSVEERNGVLVLIPTTARGAPGTERATEKRKMRYFESFRLRHSDTLYATELQNVREFVGDKGAAVTVLMQVQTEMARRLTGPTGLTSNMEYTWEYHRLGAVQGLLQDADGSTLYNWFTEFGITPATEIGFNLAAGATPSGASVGTIRPLCNGVIRAMKRASKGAWTPSTKVVALCGDTFYDQFTNHYDVKQTFLNWAAAKDLREGAQFNAFSEFTFGDITWMNYRGSDDNSTIAIPTDKVKFIPVGAPGVFQVAWAPGEGIQHVNQPGRPLIVQPILDRDRNEHIRFELSSYPLHICTRPDMLQSGRSES